MLRTESCGPITRVEMARTLAGRPVYAVAAFLLEDTLVDSGCPHTARALVRWCRGRDVRRVVTTHYHEDHSGGNAALIAAYGVEVVAPAASLPRLQRFYRLPLYRRIAWGQPRDHRAAPLGAEVEIGRYRFRVVPTPGHSDDHVSLFEEREGWLFSGDLYISARARYLRRGEDAWQILASLRKVLALSPRLLACSHAGFVPDAGAALRAKIAYWERLAQRAAELRRQGASRHAITRALLGREGFLTWFSLGDFSKYNLICSLLREPEDATQLSLAQRAVHG